MDSLKYNAKNCKFRITRFDNQYISYRSTVYSPKHRDILSRNKINTENFYIEELMINITKIGKFNFKIT